MRKRMKQFQYWFFFTGRCAWGGGSTFNALLYLLWEWGRGRFTALPTHWLLPFKAWAGVTSGWAWCSLYFQHFIKLDTGTHRRAGDKSTARWKKCSSGAHTSIVYASSRRVAIRGDVNVMSKPITIGAASWQMRSIARKPEGNTCVESPAQSGEVEKLLRPWG
jgi:hypothetical protein